MELEESEIASRTLYDGKVIKVCLSDVKLPNGHTALREVVRHSGGAAVLLVRDGCVLLERQFRFPYGKVLWEVPAGKLNKGEKPLDAAKRELEEETGFRAEKLTPLVNVYPSPGYTDEIIYVYYADSAANSSRHLDEDEFINVQFVPIDKCLEMIECGEICDAKTLAAIYKYLHDSQSKA